MPLDNFGIVRKGALYRCAQPRTRRDFEDLRAVGVTAIMKLTTEGEFPLANERAWFDGCVTVRDVPMFQPSAELLRDAAAELNARIWAGAVLAVHCLHGRDRTGAVIGAWRLLYDGWSLEQVQEERRAFGASFIIDVFDHELVTALREIDSGLRR